MLLAHAGHSQKVSELSVYTGDIIGPAKVLSIEAGETIDLSAKYWYTEAPGDPLTSVAEILAGTLLNLGAASSGIIPSGPETGMALLNNVSGDQFGALNTFINDAFDDVDFSKPQAYLVYMYFNKNMELDPMSSGIAQVGDANALGQLTKQGITAKDDGFFYTYVTNRSAGKVNFDNMTIKHWAPVVRVVYNYYPYGLTWENPALPTDPSGDGIHDCAYQDKEFQFAEFTTGHGLALYDFHARMYDPCTARWLVPDPAAQFANPYLAMGNNPVMSIDPDGQWIHILIGAVVGAVVNTVVHWDEITAGGEFHWDEFGKAAAIGAVAGAVVAATGGAMTAAAGGVGAGGFATGFGVGAFSTTAGNIILSEGNHAAFGDPRWTGEQYAMGALAGGIMGGAMNGWASVKNGNGFWNGKPGYNSNVMASGGAGNMKGGSYDGPTGNGNAPDNLVMDEFGNFREPEFILGNDAVPDRMNLYGTKNSTRLDVNNFTYDEVKNFVSEGQQVNTFSNGKPGTVTYTTTRDGALLKYEAYPISRTTQGPTIKLSYWNSKIDDWTKWMTFRFTQ